VNGIRDWLNEPIPDFYMRVFYMFFITPACLTTSPGWINMMWGAGNNDLGTRFIRCRVKENLMPAMDYSKTAAYYDLYAHTLIDVEFFIQEAGGCKNVLELTSGTGRLSLPLIRAGVHLSCLDNSPEMLAVLREKIQREGLRAHVYEMDARTFSIPEKFDLIIIPFNTFSEFETHESQADVLRAIRNHLSPAGRAIITLHNPPIRLKMIDGQIHTRGEFRLPDEDGFLVLSSREEYDPVEKMVNGEQIYEIRHSNGAQDTRFSVKIRFALPDWEEIQSIFKDAGFKIVSLYGDYNRAEYQPETSPFMIWNLVPEDGEDHPSGV
jgi:SAM-dependent methyltransferase